MEKEEGEMSDDNAMLIDEEDIVKEVPVKQEPNCTVLYRAEKSGIVIEQLEKIDAAKIEERARRFGINISGNRLVSQTQIDELYANAGIQSGNERHFRFDALHLTGVDGLTTREIFEYLEDYKPVSLEKVDDVSCNVVCQDHISVALALLVHSREIRNDELKVMLSEKSCHHWREGMPHPKKDLILMRFATNSDKKVAKKKTADKSEYEYHDQSMDSVSKNPWGDLCKSWGVYDHQEVFQRKLPKNDYEENIEQPIEPVKIKNRKLAMRLGKRTHRSEESDESGSESEWNKKSKAPRMRMHADDEESKQNKKKQVSDVSREGEKDTYTPLSIEVVNSSNSHSNYTSRQATKLSDKFKFHNKSNASVKTDRMQIQSRLGAKIIPPGELSSDDYSSDNSEHNIMSSVEKVNMPRTSNVWSRLEKTGKDSTQSDLRQMLKSKKQDKPVNARDLRDRIGKSKKSNLRIEIDNNYANRLI